jgi:hypothetical protein
MPTRDPTPPTADRLLVKLRPGSALRAAESRAGLRPLYDGTRSAAAALGMGGEPQWYVADAPGGAGSAWDLAHDRVADRLGVADADVLFVEPDLVHGVFPPESEEARAPGLAVGEACANQGQDSSHGQPVGQGTAWHLGDAYSQLGSARDQVEFTDPRTRIAHLDTGYYQPHLTLPAHVLQRLERNFVTRDDDPNSSADPDNRVFLIDNSGHGTGTLSILAGGRIPEAVVAYGGALPEGVDDRLGGAPEAEVLPLRIADSVVLLRTSAFARALDYALEQRCDVVTMSMGGLPSRVWREAVDRAYLAGVFIVAASGDSFAGLPTRNVVYPARYGRVLAACGVMADGRPYAYLEGRALEGSFGPKHVMGSALSTYAPNIPWAIFGCAANLRLNGGGTSAATPQIAAAAALWYEKYKAELPRDWRRVEAARDALFASAKQTDDLKHLGRGVLQARDALARRPRLGLQQTPSDRDSFAFFRVLTGLGIQEVPPREEMFNLELMQRWLLNRELQEIVPDPDETETLPPAELRRFMEAVVEDRGASAALRKQVAARYPVAAGGSVERTKRNADVVTEVLPACEALPALRDPAYRRLRVYAVDPSYSARLDTAAINEVTLPVRWERLEAPGPIGEYLAVDDVDAAGVAYDPVDLNDPRLLAQDGWAPSEGNAYFHQQMVYAVAMKTVEHFERALGRPVLWRPRPRPGDDSDDGDYAQRLLVRPHALRQANAYYSPEEIALKFGNFESVTDAAGETVPGSRVYSCLSHDIIAHETTHAVLDGMHRHFNEPTNPDVLALHEGFADIVALMQHFTIPELLRAQIQRTRGDLESESMLGSLAIQFGRAMGGRGALRDAIGRLEGGVWKRFEADPADLQRRLTPHARGAVLVAAVFDAFLAIYRTRTADLLRLYTGGTGVLAHGAIHPDLVARLADEAVKAAGHVLTMCIRALDYLPPVDVTFFEYLRGLITADFDLVRDDRYDYRVAFVEAFRRRGVYPANLGAPTADTPRNLAVDTLRWQGLGQTSLAGAAGRQVEKQYRGVIEQLRRFADDCFYVGDRESLFRATRRHRGSLHAKLRKAFTATPKFAADLGLDPGRPFEVQELRRALRIGPDGGHLPQVVVGLTQAKEVPADGSAGVPAFEFRGGSTLVVDLSIPEVKYRIVKRIDSGDRQARTAAFVREAASDPLRALFFSPDRPEPFAALHALADEGV